MTMSTHVHQLPSGKWSVDRMDENGRIESTLIVLPRDGLSFDEWLTNFFQILARLDPKRP